MLLAGGAEQGISNYTQNESYVLTENYKITRHASVSGTMTVEDQTVTISYTTTCAGQYKINQGGNGLIDVVNWACTIQHDLPQSAVSTPPVSAPYDFRKIYFSNGKTVIGTELPSAVQYRKID